MLRKKNSMTQKNRRKFWGFLAVWLILFLIVKSIEKLLLITLVVAAGYFVTRVMRTTGKGSSQEDKVRKNK